MSSRQVTLTVWSRELLLFLGVFFLEETVLQKTETLKHVVSTKEQRQISKGR